MSGYGEKSGGNITYFTLKVKRGEAIDPHMEIRKYNSDSEKYEIVSDKAVWVEGMLSGIGHETYTLKENATPKDKITITLVNGSEVYKIQTGMNSHARNLILTILKLIKESPENIGSIKISVYEKNGFSNTQTIHEGEFVNWIIPYEEQKVYHDDGKDGYTDYDRFHTYLLERWMKAKTYLETFSKYKERADFAAKNEEGKGLPSDVPATPAPQTEASGAIPDTSGMDDDLPF